MTYLDPLRFPHHLEMKNMKARVVQGSKVVKQKLDYKLLSLTSKPMGIVPKVYVKIHFLLQNSFRFTENPPTLV